MTTHDDNEPLHDGVATEPPPDGEQDPYGAPTRVARVPENLLDDLRGRYLATANANANAAIANANANAIANANAAIGSAPDLAALAAAAAHTVKPPRPTPPAGHDAAIPCSHDDLDGRAVPMQSGRTVPLSAALLADVIRSVDQKRAAAARAPLAAPLEPSPAMGVPLPPRRSALGLALILLLGVGIFAVGVAMFLDAIQ